MLPGRGLCVHSCMGPMGALWGLLWVRFTWVCDVLVSFNPLLGNVTLGMAFRFISG